jgi:hypothetical protein
MYTLSAIPNYDAFRPSRAYDYNLSDPASYNGTGNVNSVGTFYNAILAPTNGPTWVPSSTVINDYQEYVNSYSDLLADWATTSLDKWTYGYIHWVNSGEGELRTMPTRTVGGRGGYFNFDGVDDALVYSSGIRSFSANTFSWEFWVRPTGTITIVAESTSGLSGTSGQKYLKAAEPNGADTLPGISVGTNGIQIFEYNTGYMPCLASYSGSLSSVNFSHIVLVYNNKQPSIYLNGVLVRTGLTSTFSGSILGLVNNIGSGAYGSFSGDIAFIRGTATAPSAADIYLEFLSRQYRYGLA